VILELYDNRLPPLASRDYPFTYRLPEAVEGLQLRVRVRYHILTDKAYEALKTKYGMQGDYPYHFTIYERTVHLSGPLAAEIIPLGRDHASPGPMTCKKEG
jgi:hypothetical protein